MKEKKNYNIKPTPICMNYVKVDPNKSQYEPFDPEVVTKIVTAKYVHSDVYPGNPLIEAIPVPRDAQYIFDSCQRVIPGFSHKKLADMPVHKQVALVSAYKKIHYVLPTQGTLENLFYMSLVNSYSSRKFLQSANCNINNVVLDTNVETNRVLLGDAANAAYCGFSMIGKSGCGKSTSLNDLLAHYPQVIIHWDEDGRPFVQILYIVVNCTKKSNFRALYENIGEAIDKALGNVKPVYKLELTCRSKDNLGVVNNKLRNIIERLCIGMIILDEFQNMSLDSSSENSMDALLFLGNETKVVFGVVGTRFSKNFLNKPDDLKSRRRLGVEIPADSYCQNEKFVYEFIDWLFQFQMFIPYVTPNAEIKDALMECSAGIIDQIISIFSFMNTDYIMRPPEKRAAVNGIYVREIANKYFPSMQRLLKKMTLTQIEEEELRREKQEAEDKVNEAALALMAAENKLNETSSASAMMNERIAIRDEAASNLYLRLDKKYNKAHIEQYVVSAMENITKGGKELTVEAVEEAAKAEIEKTKPDTRKTTKNALLKQRRPATNEELNDALDM